MDHLKGTKGGNSLLEPAGIQLQEFISNLPPLTSSQQELVNRAKKYALEQSVSNLIQKQILTTQQQQQKAVQRHKALTLMCRVYVGSISFELKEESIKTAFSPYGAVKTISMSWDPVSLKHKGYAFVEFELPEAAQLALDHMNGIQLGNRQIKVGWPSNTPQAAPIIQQIQEECEARHRIYVSNVHPDLKEQELSNLFDPFGKVSRCKLAMMPDVAKPQHRGYGFMEFETHTASADALTMDNLDLGGQIIHVCRAITPDEHLSTYGGLDQEKAQASAVASGATIQPPPSGGEPTIEATSYTAESEFTSTPTSNINNTGKTQAELLIESKVVSNGRADVGSVSSVLVLRNMMTADDELDDSLQLDIYEECRKYGPVLQVVVYVDRKGRTPQKDDEIKIFVKYKDRVSGEQAREALNGRFFGGRKISAEHYDRDLFRQSDYST